VGAGAGATQGVLSHAHALGNRKLSPPPPPHAAAWPMAGRQRWACVPEGRQKAAAGGTYKKRNLHANPNSRGRACRRRCGRTSRR